MNEERAHELEQVYLEERVRRLAAERKARALGHLLDACLHLISHLSPKERYPGADPAELDAWRERRYAELLKVRDELEREESEPSGERRTWDEVWQAILDEARADGPDAVAQLEHLRERMSRSAEAAITKARLERKKPRRGR